MRSNLSAIPLLFLAAVILLLVAIAAGHLLDQAPAGGHQSVPPVVTGELKRYASGSELLASFADAATYGRSYGTWDSAPAFGGITGTVSLANAAPQVKGSLGRLLDDERAGRRRGRGRRGQERRHLHLSRLRQQGDHCPGLSCRRRVGRRLDRLHEDEPEGDLHRRRPPAGLRHVLRRHHADACRRRRDERVDHALVWLVDDRRSICTISPTGRARRS